MSFHGFNKGHAGNSGCHVSLKRLVTVSEDGNTLYLWEGPILSRTGIRIGGSTADTLNELYPDG